MADGTGFQYPTNFLVMGTQPYRISAAQYQQLQALIDAKDGRNAPVTDVLVRQRQGKG